MSTIYATSKLAFPNQWLAAKRAFEREYNVKNIDGCGPNASATVVTRAVHLQPVCLKVLKQTQMLLSSLRIEPNKYGPHPISPSR